MNKRIIDINGNKVFIENGEIKTILNENIQKTGFMSVEEGKKITLEAVKMILKQDGRL